MIKTRLITDDDYSMLSASLLLDDYHKDTLASFFYETGTMCLVYEDEQGPVLFLRGKPILENGIGIIQLDIQYLSNLDARRNMRTMLEGFPELEKMAKANGFSGLFFISSSPLLRKFCVRRLGFKEDGAEVLVKSLLDKDKEAC